MGNKREVGRTVGVERFPVGRSNREDGRHEDVLEGRDEEQRRVLEVERLELVYIDFRLLVPERASRRLPISFRRKR